MVVVVGSNIFSETWATLYAVISGSTLDPGIAGPTRPGSKWIVGAFPDIEGPSFPNYPIVVIDNPAKTSDKQGFSTTGLVNNELSTSIFVYSKTPRELNILSEDVSDAVLINRSVLQVSGLQLMTIDDGTNGTDIIGNQRIHFKEQIIRLELIT